MPREWPGKLLHSDRQKGKGRWQKDRKGWKKGRGFFSDNRKLIRKFALLFWLTAGLIVLLIGMQTWTDYSLQEIADQNYGLWQAAVYDCTPSQLRMLENNPLLETLGSQIIEGSVVQIDESEPDEFRRETGHGSIGYADPAFYHLANLQLKLGRLPQSEDEIAAEAAALDSLGLSYTLGQTITLSVRIDENTIENRTWKLSGVLENYSSFWNSNGNLIRYFTAAPKTGLESHQSADSLSSSPHQTRHVFFKAVNGYEDIMKSIQHSLGDHMLIENTGRMISRDPFSDENRLITALLLLALILCSILVFEILLFWIYRHQKEIRLIRILGQRKTILCKDLLRLLWKALRWPALAVTVFCIMTKISFWLSLLLSGTISVLLLLCVALVSLFVCSIKPLPKQRIAMKTGRHRKSDKRNGSDKKRKKRRPEKAEKVGNTGNPSLPTVITIRMVEKRLSFSLRKSQIFCMTTMCLTEAVCIFGGFQLFQTAAFIRSSKEMSDYTLSSKDRAVPRYRYTEAVDGEKEETIYVYQNRKPVSQNVLDILKSNGNLKVLEYFSLNQDNVISWENQEGALLFHTRPLLENQTGTSRPDFSDGHPGMLQPDPKGIWRYYGEVIQIEQPELIERLKQTEMEGEIDWNTWREGKQAIVYLPPAEEMQPGLLVPSWKGESDSSLSLGDLLTVTRPDGTTDKIPVSAIVRDPAWNFLSAGVYGVVTGGSEITNIFLKLTSEQNQIPVEVFLSQLASEMDLMFTNEASSRIRYRTQVKIRAATIAFFCIIACLTCLFILQINFQLLKTNLDHFQRVCHKLGLRKSVAAKIRGRFMHHLMGQTLIWFFVVLAFSTIWIASSAYSRGFPAQSVLWCLSSGGIFVLALGIFCLLCLRSMDLYPKES